jgi:hypothetical protein
LESSECRPATSANCLCDVIFERCTTAWERGFAKTNRFSAPADRFFGLQTKHDSFSVVRASNRLIGVTACCFEAEGTTVPVRTVLEYDLPFLVV